LRPDTGGLLDDLATHPHIIVGRLTTTDAAAIEQLLQATNTFDVLAGWIVHTCDQRGWPVLTTDPGRLQRIAPDLDVNLL
jgi:hypothetical protein